MGLWHMEHSVSDSGVEKEDGPRRRNEGKGSLMTESNPAISCTQSQSRSALSIYGNGIYM